MGPGLTIRWRNIPVSLNWTLLGLIGFVSLLALGPLALWFPETGTGLRLVGSTVAVVVFFASILAHEAAHAWAARRHDVTVERITLWLFGGLTEFTSRVPSAKAEFQIAVVGPLSNFIIGGFFAIGAYLLDAAENPPLSGLLAGLMAGLAIVNLMVGAFNLIPAPPLDGGRLLAAGLWRKTGDSDVAKLLAGRMGLVAWLGLAAVGLTMVVRQVTRFNGWWSLGLGVFFALIARSEIFSAAISLRLRRLQASELMTTHPVSVKGSELVADLVRRAGPQGSHVAHPVVDWGHEPVGYVVPAVGSLLDASAQSWTRVDQIMVPVTHSPRAWSDESLDSILGRLDEGAQLVVIHDPKTTEPVGTVSASQIRPYLKKPDYWGRD